jgi:acyl-CoA reductase-like NAD-dependent aldehyde dehydrogenase
VSERVPDVSYASPFGGYNDKGIGREQGEETLEEYR